MNWDALHESLGTWLDDRRLIAEPQAWVVGVSGGPDSTLLLHCLLDFARRRGLDWELHAAHLHHGLRGAEADEDEAFVARTAEALGVRFHAEHADIRDQVARRGGSMEEVARETRYQFLERVALRVGSDTVAVAHHADDNAETILHRICRGTGLRGLAGINELRPITPGSRVRLVRPLLPLRRATIEQMCVARGIAFRQDSSNASPEFTRNRIRTLILPALRQQLNPQVDDALLRLAELARGMGDYLEDAAARIFESLVVAEAPGRITLNTGALLSKQRIIQTGVVQRALSLLVGSDDELTFGHIKAVLRLAEDPASGKELHLPGKIVVRKQYDRLEFAPLGADEPAPELPSMFIVCPGRTPLPQIGYELVTELRDVGPGKIEELRARANPFEEWLDYERLRFPLLVRGRRDGDRFRPLGAPGAKTLGDFLGDMKIDPATRGRTGILCDQEGPIWIMPLRIEERVKLRLNSQRALRCTLEPLHAGGGG